MLNNFELENTNKEEVFAYMENYFKSRGLIIKETDKSRPWGGFFVINSQDIFLETFFDMSYGENNNISPKILIVAPGQKLSWQYHHRRSEVWKVLYGDPLVVRSINDEQNAPEPTAIGQIIEIKPLERHRIIGGKGWSVIAEIWKHTDAIPSDEYDIVRLVDLYGRAN